MGNEEGARPFAANPTESHLTIMELSMFALRGITGSRTMKLRGKIVDVKVVCDGG